ncbi:MAG: PhoU domain-containing protein [Nitriliruptor sp.]
MVFGFRSDAGERLDRIEESIQQMLRDDAHSIELAMSALLGKADPHTVGPELRATDHKVNEAERNIRRDLVVHASVHGSIDTPAILVYMSIVKDIERIGDYAKNLFDLAADGSDLSTTSRGPRHTEMHAEMLRMIEQVGVAFHERDPERSRTLLTSGDELLDDFDDAVSALVRSDSTGDQSVAQALAYRYYKRIVAHLLNVLSAVVMPVDRLDYFDEDPEDR